MPFNSNSYHRNKALREAREALARARVAKARGALREPWESDTSYHVKMARFAWRRYLSFRAIDRMHKDHREMSPAEFIARYT